MSNSKSWNSTSNCFLRCLTTLNSFLAKWPLVCGHIHTLYPTSADFDFSALPSRSLASTTVTTSHCQLFVQDFHGFSGATLFNACHDHFMCLGSRLGSRKILRPVHDDFASQVQRISFLWKLHSRITLLLSKTLEMFGREEDSETKKSRS